MCRQSTDTGLMNESFEGSLNTVISKCSEVLPGNLLCLSLFSHPFPRNDLPDFPVLLGREEPSWSPSYLWESNHAGSCHTCGVHCLLTLACPALVGKEFSSWNCLLCLNHSLLLKSRVLINSLHKSARPEMERWNEQGNPRIILISNSTVHPQWQFGF